MNTTGRSTMQTNLPQHTAPKYQIQAMRALEWAELERLEESRGVSNGSRIQNIRQIHHKIARLMASGCNNVEIAAATTFAPGTIGRLRTDPAFQELLSHYEECEFEGWQDARQKAAMVGMTAFEILQERLLHQPEEMKTKDLVEIAQGGLDYGGLKPPQRSENVHYHTSAEEIQRIKEGRTENVSVRSGALGDADDEATEHPEGVIEGEWEESSGDSVREAGAGEDSDAAGDNPAESVD